MPGFVHRDEMLRLLEEGGAELLEVLPREEYEEEHLPGAINIPLKEIIGRRPPGSGGTLR